jgi:GntR family transcriptional regulator
MTRHEDVCSGIAAAFTATDTTRGSKQARLHDAIVAQIDTGVLTAGQKLPGERELCDATGISLGTVQKALSLLVADGKIVREHGRGTFVHTGRRPMTELWHFRFRDPETGELLPPYARLLVRKHVQAASPWSEVLGSDLSGYVGITRIVSVGDRFRCWSQMHLPFGRFSGLLKMARADIENVNLKQVLAAKFGAATVATSQTVLLRSFPTDVAEAVGVEPGSMGLLLQIVGVTHGAVPITFQRIWVPETDCELEIGADAVTAVQAVAA